MAKYFMLALGFFLAIAGSSLALTVDELTDADLTKFGEMLRAPSAGKSGYTCENYELKCKDAGPTRENTCKIVMKKYACENLRDAQGMKQILKAVEAAEPEFIAEFLENIKNSGPIIDDETS